MHFQKWLIINKTFFLHLWRLALPYLRHQLFCTIFLLPAVLMDYVYDYLYRFTASQSDIITFIRPIPWQAASTLRLLSLTAKTGHSNGKILEFPDGIFDFLTTEWQQWLNFIIIFYYLAFIVPSGILKTQNAFYKIVVLQNREQNNKGKYSVSNHIHVDIKSIKTKHTAVTLIHPLHLCVFTVSQGSAGASIASPLQRVHPGLQSITGRPHKISIQGQLRGSNWAKHAWFWTEGWTPQRKFGGKFWDFLSGLS